MIVTHVFCLFLVFAFVGCSTHKKQNFESTEFQLDEGYKKIQLIKERFKHDARYKNELYKLSSILGVDEVEKVEIKEMRFPRPYVVFEVVEKKETSLDGSFSQRILKIESNEITHETDDELSTENTVVFGRFFSNPGNTRLINGCTLGLNDSEVDNLDVIVDKKTTCSAVNDIIDSIKNRDLFVPEELQEQFTMIKLESLEMVNFESNRYNLYFRIGSEAHKILEIERIDIVFRLKSISILES
jgi:hypothetical protein